MGHKKKKVTSATKAPGTKAPAKKKAKKVLPPWPTDLEYIKLFDDCVIKKEKIAEVDKVIDDNITPNRSRYETVVAQASGVGISNSLLDIPGLGGQGLFGNSTLPGATYQGIPSLRDISSANQMPGLLRNMQVPSVPGSGLGTAGNLGIQGALALGRNLPATGDAASGTAGAVQDATTGLGGDLLSNGFNTTPGLGGLYGAFGFQFSTARGIPWYFVAVTHYMECSSSFKKHLHNGDLLTGYTTHVPAGRPKVGHGPPFTWEESAVDALKLEHLDKVQNWSLGAMLHRIEAYNGAGYKNRSMNSPYLWSYSNQYTKGKYAADGKFDPELVSKQVGAAVILKRLEDRGIIYIPRS